VRHLVYLCAFAVDAGESCMATAIAESEAAQISWEGRPNLAEAFVGDDDGLLVLEAEGAAACFYNDCDEGTAAWAAARLGPQPIVTLEQEPAAVAWRERPSTYVVCSDDYAVHPDLQRIVAARCSEVLEWPSSHSPFLSQPERVADLLVGIGTRLAQEDAFNPSAS
jgi:hypothetical protein